MKTVLSIFFFSMTVLLMACSKDKFESKPRIEIKDVSASEIPVNGILRVRLNYFDKEGDLSESPFLVIRQRLNLQPLSPLEDKADTIRSLLPKFPKRDAGELDVQYEWGFLSESAVQNDTLILRFVVQDNAGNISDTLNSGPIVIDFQ